MKPQRIDENHSFSIQLAKVVGIEKAILLKELYGWCYMNLGNSRNVHFNSAWTYNSAKTLSDKFIYMGKYNADPEKQKESARRNIARWFTELENDGWILVSNFNKRSFDKTNWYTIFFEKYDALLSGKEISKEGLEWWNSIKTAIGKNVQSVGNDVQALDNLGSSVGHGVTTIPSPTISYHHLYSFSNEKEKFDFSQSEIEDLENQLNAKKEPKEERLREVEVITPIEEVASDPPKQKPVKAARKKRESAPDLLFRESDYFLLPNGRELFENELVKRNEKFASFDINYYFEAALNWSDSKDGTMKNWVAAVANWIERDTAKGTAKKNGKIIPLAQTPKKAGQLTEYQNQVENGEYVIVEGRKISRATYQAVMARHAPTVGSQ